MPSPPSASTGTKGLAHGADLGTVNITASTPVGILARHRAHDAHGDGGSSWFYPAHTAGADDCQRDHAGVHCERVPTPTTREETSPSSRRGHRAAVLSQRSQRRGYPRRDDRKQRGSATITANYNGVSGSTTQRDDGNPGVDRGGPGNQTIAVGSPSSTSHSAATPTARSRSSRRIESSGRAAAGHPLPSAMASRSGRRRRSRRTPPSSRPA